MAYLPGPKLGEGDEYELRPPGDPVYNIDEPYEAKIVGWRAECFEALGFDQLRAVAMAVRRDVDREQVKRMIRAGATPMQAAEIVL